MGGESLSGLLLVCMVVIVIAFLVGATVMFSVFAENKQLRAEIAKFDGDGDGRIGGSRKRGGAQ